MYKKRLNMNRLRLFGHLLICTAWLSVLGCDSLFQKSEHQPVLPMATDYDMRDDLQPSRLTVAMWDYSWLNGHYPGGPFEDFAKVMDELIERGFNTVRIDPHPLIIDQMALKAKTLYTIKADPLANWGVSTMDFQHDVVAELIDFMTIARRKGIYVILSSWGAGRADYSNIEDFWRAWQRVLDILADRQLLDHVLYVDFDQEFPFFSPFADQLKRLAKEESTHSMSNSQAMEMAVRRDLKWNPSQMRFVRNYFSDTISHFQNLYPSLRFTFSLTSYWKEVRAMKLECMDVLELHIWIHGDRFENRTGFNSLIKNRDPANDYREYMSRLNATMHSVRPMLLKEMHNKMAFARDWSAEAAAPVVVTESWGPWWHMDHRDLQWQWLYDWCEQCMGLSSAYGFWGSTPWNYCHPYWSNWSNVDWYQRVNRRFLTH